MARFVTVDGFSVLYEKKRVATGRYDGKKKKQHGLI